MKRGGRKGSQNHNKKRAAARPAECGRARGSVTGRQAGEKVAPLGRFREEMRLPEGSYRRPPQDPPFVRFDAVSLT